MRNALDHWPKYVIGWIVCFAVRLIPGKPPNVEPILATTMPFAEVLGPLPGMVFAFLSIVIFDLAVGQAGSWTFLTGTVYALVALGGWAVLRGNRGRIRGYVVYGIIGTLIYDAVTGVCFGPLFYGQSWREAFVGQIPFTINHVLGTIAFSAILSPLLYRWVTVNPRMEFSALMTKRK